MHPPPAAAPQQHQPAAAGGWIWLLEQSRLWLHSDGQRWAFVARTLLASYCALWLAFRLGLDAPYTALATSVILALPHSGMVLEKAFHRFLGTLVGCAAALLLVALLPQSPVLLFAGLALWVGLCTSGAAMQRNQQSYSFVLAGYTACMIAVPALDAPAQVFTLAVTRVTEVGVGILCAAVIHDVVFPRRHAHNVLRTAQSRYNSFIHFCTQVLEQRLTPAETELTHLKFAADIAALESGRAAAFFEAGDGRARTRQLHAFNAAFMTVLTTFHTLHRLIHRLHGAAPQHAQVVLALVQPLHAHLALAMADTLSAPRLQAMRSALAQDIGAARYQLQQLATQRPIARAQQIDFDTTVELLERYVRDLADFSTIYHALTQDGGQQASDPGTYAPKTPGGIVLASGARAATTVLLAATAWYWLAWPQFGNAIVIATIFCALASSSPRPTALIRQVLIGFMLAAPLAFITEFFMLVHADDFATLVLASLPVLGLGAYLLSGQRWAGVGIGICMFCATLLVPGNLMHYDVEGFINSEVALILGVLLAYLMFAVVLPEHTMGQRDHVAGALWREARRTCSAPLLHLKRRYDNRVRDLLSQLNAAAGPAPDSAVRAIVRQALTLLELGHAIIALRQFLAHAPDSTACTALQQLLLQLARYLRTPDADQAAAALQATLDTGTAVRAQLAHAGAAQQRALQATLPELHAIYTTLQDQLSTGALRHAA